MAAFEQIESHELLENSRPQGGWVGQLNAGLVLAAIAAFAAGAGLAQLVLEPSALYAPPTSATMHPPAAVVSRQPHLQHSRLPLNPAHSMRLHKPGMRSTALGVFAQSVHDFTVKDSNGGDVSLADYKGKVLLIVNVASESRFTPQYRALHDLQEKYKDMPFSILAFPCNQFNQEEPKSSEEVAEYAQSHFAIDFPVMEKIDVNGDHAAALYSWLKEQKTAVPLMQGIMSNFEKFLVDKNGQVVEHYTAMRDPETIAPDIDRLLAQ